MLSTGKMFAHIEGHAHAELELVCCIDPQLKLLSSRLNTHGSVCSHDWFGI